MNIKGNFVPACWLTTKEAAEHLLGASRHYRSRRVIYNLQKQIDGALRFYRDNPDHPDRAHEGLKGQQGKIGRWSVLKEQLEAWAIRRNVPGWGQS